MNDIDRGKAILDSGEPVQWNELREGDQILGVGKVTYVHLHVGGFIHLRVENAWGEEADLGRQPGDRQVTVKQRTP